MSLRLTWVSRETLYYNPGWPMGVMPFLVVLGVFRLGVGACGKESAYSSRLWVAEFWCGH